VNSEKVVSYLLNAEDTHKVKDDAFQNAKDDEVIKPLVKLIQSYIKPFK
jgi:hypothetical protein